ANDCGVKVGEKALVERSHDHGKEKVSDAEDIPGSEERVADEVFVCRESQDDPWGEDGSGDISQACWPGKAGGQEMFGGGHQEAEADESPSVKRHQEDGTDLQDVGAEGRG